MKYINRHHKQIRRYLHHCDCPRRVLGDRQRRPRNGQTSQLTARQIASIRTRMPSCFLQTFKLHLRRLTTDPSVAFYHRHRTPEVFQTLPDLWETLLRFEILNFPLLTDPLRILGGVKDLTFRLQIRTL